MQDDNEPINILRLRQNGHYFPDFQMEFQNTFSGMKMSQFRLRFFNENVPISIKISPKFVPDDPIINISTLVQIMAWRRSGDKPLSESMMA